MKTMIDKMRIDFELVATARVDSGLWSAKDEAMAGAAIKRAIDKNENELVLCWARWLANLAARDLMDFQPSKPAATVVRECGKCALFFKPGLSAGHCGGRDDLAHAYGEGHPLRVLPNDGGASCDRFRERC